MSEVLKRIELLSSEAGALEQALPAAKGADRQAVRSRGQSGSYPMSSAQQQMWSVDQPNPTHPDLNFPVAIRLEGRLEVDALNQSFQEIVKRHEILRTIYGVREGIRVQVILPYHPVPLLTQDLLQLNPLDREAAIQRLILESANRPFDLAAGPVVRTELIRLAKDERALLVGIHHIASDAWSMGVFFRELADGYNACMADRSPTRPALPLQYADYARSQREWMESPDAKESLSFWRRHLEGLTPVELPTDHARPPALSHEGGLIFFRLASDLLSKLRNLAEAEEATLSMALLAGFTALLARYTGLTDLAVGSCATGRDSMELEGLIGNFANPIVLRTDVSGELTFRELIRRTRTVALDAEAHSTLPFDLVVRELQPQPDASRAPLAPVMMVVDDRPDELPSFDGLVATRIEPKATSTKYDLLIHIRPTNDGLSGRVGYSADLFEPDTVERLVGHFRTLLEAATRDPDLRVSMFPLLTEPEQQQILVQWNDTEAPYPADACLHELFEGQARSRPQAPAVLFGDRMLSYADINLRANRLAHFLRRQGVGPEVTVAVCLERSPELVVAILAVLKAGGAYIPFDPSYSTGRLSFMVRDAGAPILLTQDSLRKRLDAQSAEVVCLGKASEFLSAESVSDPRSGVTPRSLAYVICTSGSAGTPKAIALEHRGVLNNLVDLNQRFNVGPGDRVLFLSSPSFDMSVYETLGVLAAGGSLIIPDPGAAKDPAHWVDLMVRHKVTVWNSAPVLLELLVEQLERDNGPALPDLRVALLGGDWIPVTLPDRLTAFAPDVQLISLGGATEASIHSTIYPVKETDSTWASIPYGRPMTNQRVYILDKSLLPTPIGVPGELHLAGVGLARGYLHRPDLTAERFFEHSFGNGKVERLYRTGDLARWRRDGVIELLGRIDFQVKIHGLRIELGEVESSLRRHKAVQDAVVVAHEGRETVKCLTAYFVARPGQDVSEIELRSHLARTLPSYMIPTFFVPLDRLPTNENGKVDRKALPAAGSSGRAGDTIFPAPRNELETMLGTIFADLLGADQVGIDDDFFDSGGDSLLALKLVAKVEESLGRRISLAMLLEAPTVRDLARLLSGELSLRGVPGVVTIQQGGSRPAFFCVGAGPLHWRLASLLGPDQPYLGLDLDEADYKTLAWPFKIEDAASILVKKMRELQPAGPYFVGGQCSHGVIAYEMAQQLRAAGDEARLIVLYDAGNPAGTSRYQKEIQERGWLGRASVLGQRMKWIFGILRRKGVVGFAAYAREKLKFELQKMRPRWDVYWLGRKVADQPDDTQLDLINFEYLAIPGYRPMPYAGNVALLRDPVPPEHPYLDLDGGWSEVVKGNLEIRFLPGTSDDLFREPYVRVTARVLKEVLTEAQAFCSENHAEAASRP